MTHLLSIACAEATSPEAVGVIPADGYLTVFADLHGTSPVWDCLEPDDPGREHVLIVHTPRAEAVQEPGPPPRYADRGTDDPPAELPERRVRLDACLQLRTDFGVAGELLGIDDRAARAAVDVAAAVNGVGPHQLGGHPWCVQEDPRPILVHLGEAAAEPVTLLHLGSDHDLGLTLGDAGTLHLYGDAADVRARRWDRLTCWHAGC